MTNPLLDFADLPLFDAVTPDHVEAAVDALLVQAETALEQVTQDSFPSEWQAIAKVLDVATECLGRSWGAVSHLNSVADNPELWAGLLKVGCACKRRWICGQLKLNLTTTQDLLPKPWPPEILWAEALGRESCQFASMKMQLFSSNRH